jgi:hypothetical protein
MLRSLSVYATRGGSPAILPTAASSIKEPLTLPLKRAKACL